MWRQTERQTGRQTHAYPNTMNLFLTQHDPHHYYLPFPCFHLNAEHICIYSTPWKITDYPLSSRVKLCMYKQRPLWPPEKSRRNSEIKNNELNLLQEGQQCTVDPVSLHYDKRNINRNIFENTIQTAAGSRLLSTFQYVLFWKICVHVAKHKV